MRPDRPPLALQIMFLGKHVAYMVERRVADRGLNRTQSLILIALSHHPGMKALDLSGPARVEPPNVTRTLQSLERLGLLERRAHPTDGRASQFFLTPAGERLAGELAEDLRTISAELLQGVPPDQQANVESILENLFLTTHRLRGPECARRIE